MLFSYVSFRHKLPAVFPKISRTEEKLVKKYSHIFLNNDHSEIWSNKMEENVLSPFLFFAGNIKHIFAQLINYSMDVIKFSIHVRLSFILTLRCFSLLFFHL